MQILLIAALGILAWMIYQNGGLGAITQAVSSATGSGSIAGYAANAGFSGSDLQTAVAVAYAESGGKTSAYNPETAAGTPSGQGSIGLWQIYLYKHPEFTGWNLYDGQTNANAAYSVYSAAGQSFSPWSTYNSGVYSSYIQKAQTCIATITSTATDPASEVET